MKRINLSFVSVLVTILVITVVAAIVFAAIGDYKDRYDKKKAEEVRDTVLSYVAQCYALEGRYPADLQYLEDNYGLVLNKDKYVYVITSYSIHYTKLYEARKSPVGGARGCSHASAAGSRQ